MAAPLVVSFTLRFLFAFVDMAYAAMLPGDNSAVAAIGLFVPIQNVYIALWVGLSAGFTSGLSNAFGHGDEPRISALKRSMRHVLSGLIPALLAFGGGIYFAVPHLGLDPQLATDFRTYATTLALGLPITGFLSIYPDSLVKAHQDTRSTMMAGLASSFANIGLNTLFVFAFGWGIFGLAFATVISRIAGLAYAWRRAQALESQRTAGPSTSTREWPSPFPTILRLAIPGGLTYLLTAFESGISNKVLATMSDATTRIASFAVYQQMLMLALMPATAVSVAIVPYIALNLPSGNFSRIRQELRSTTLLVLGLAIVMTILMGWVFAGPLANFFIAARPGTSGITVGPPALDALRLLPLGALAAVPFLVTRPVFEAAQRPRLGVQLSVARFAILSPLLIFAGSALAPQFGVDPLQGIILGIALASAIAAAWALRLLPRVLVRD